MAYGSSCRLVCASFQGLMLAVVLHVLNNLSLDSDFSHERLISLEYAQCHLLALNTTGSTSDMKFFFVKKVVTPTESIGLHACSRVIIQLVL